MDSVVTKLRKEPIAVTMIVRMLVLFLGGYGLSIEESMITPIVLGLWAVIEVGTMFAARSQVVPNVKLINERTGEARAKVPQDLKEKLDGGSN